MLLLRAAAHGNIQDAEKAIEAGAEINCYDYDNQTPFLLASSRKHVAFVEYLVRLGVTNEIHDHGRCLQHTSSTCKRKFLLKTDLGRIDHREVLFKQRNESSITTLQNRFPRTVAQAKMQGHHLVTMSKSSVSILFLEVVGFSELRGCMPPLTVLSMLERLFTALDTLAAQHDVERIDAVNGCYMAVANFSLQQPDDHAVRLARFALSAVYTAAAANDIDPAHPELGSVQLLAGMHCGEVCGSVVGLHGGRKHTLHGDAVNVASRMESHGAAGAVQCSPAAAALIEAQGGYSGEGSIRLAQREDVVDVKGVGRMRTFWLTPGAAALLANADAPPAAD